MLVLIARYSAHPGNGDAVAAALLEMQRLVAQHELGCLRYEVCRATSNPDHSYSMSSTPMRGQSKPTAERNIFSASCWRPSCRCSRYAKLTPITCSQTEREALGYAPSAPFRSQIGSRLYRIIQLVPMYRLQRTRPRT